MFTAIHDFLRSVLDLDVLSSDPKAYFADGWEFFKNIFLTIGDLFSFAKEELSSK
ncbi:hypothetical protein LJU02_09215 [Corynebacterium pseudotuberculosis]|uniref:hypothetical protein n=1 Tax=Corynebacterium pseudotuberculosis TaxID=1719 RepID=UPI00022BC40C|nr:hypothetical protein [Corynebacterium pseudotuberculosis]AER69813.1 Hypothetical protein Cp106_1762 [Corynebacterium pseudotuberculosis 1/06-A]AKS14151.1 Hypothetical protein CpE19_1813 [Corynebacterium pseudotuberculosis]APQ54884.1 Hypothetical protein CpMEX30_1891 [Corynebacterium pseudotuberculosis]APQ56965.1 Hypothetical protein CpMEX31_1886 [Corynebacterium pseudotuberculosis]ATB62784.1 Hypothetical protein BFF96_1913 [Corynebacterium pseudotuberculosis]